jgi:hypothetical protein
MGKTIVQETTPQEEKFVDSLKIENGFVDGFCLIYAKTTSIKGGYPSRIVCYKIVFNHVPIGPLVVKAIAKFVIEMQQIPKKAKNLEAWEIETKKTIEKTIGPDFKFELGSRGETVSKLDKAILDVEKLKKRKLTAEEKSLLEKLYS